MSAFSRTAVQAFARPENTGVVIPATDRGGQHNEILQNFVDAILAGQPLIAPAEEGLHSIELGNAMTLSTWLDQTIELPLDAARFERLLRQHIRKSRFKKQVAAPVTGEDFSKSFGR